MRLQVTQLKVREAVGVADEVKLVAQHRGEAIQTVKLLQWTAVITVGRVTSQEVG